MGMAMTLTALPNEILGDILSLLSQGELYRTALVSSRMRPLAQRVLYSSIDVCITGSQMKDSKSVFLSYHEFSGFVFFLSRKPHLQQYVSKLSIRIHDSSLGDLHEIMQQIEKILIRTPHLKSLYLCPPPLQPYEDWRSFLPCLEDLALDVGPLEAKYIKRRQLRPMKVVAHQFWVPGLKKMQIYQPSWDSSVSDLFPADQHRTASITDLQIRKCHEVTDGFLRDIILSIKTLERFTLEFRIDWFAPKSTRTTVPPEVLSQSLQVHSSTLVQLAIAGSEGAEFHPTLRIGSLAGYPHLKRLAIPEPLLVAVEDEASTLVGLLPPNLEELQLQIPLGRVQGEDPHQHSRIERLKVVAAAKPLRYPFLKQVVWWGQSAAAWQQTTEVEFGTDHDLEHLALAFKKVGVEFKSHTGSFFDCTPFEQE